MRHVSSSSDFCESHFHTVISPMFPNRNDELTIQISYAKRRSCLDYFKPRGSGRETIKIAYKAITDKVKGKGVAREPQEGEPLFQSFLVENEFLTLA